MTPRKGVSVMKTMKLGAIVLLLLCGLFPSSAFAFGDCTAVCGPTVSCGKPCILNGSGTACGPGYGCCVANQTNCGGLLASSSASGEALTLEALFAPEPMPAAPALPAFLAE